MASNHRNWFKLLLIMEFSYKIFFNIFLKNTPFKIIYGFDIFKPIDLVEIRESNRTTSKFYLIDETQ